MLTRPHHLAACGLSAAEVERVSDDLAAVAHPVRLAFRWRPRLSDPNDDMVLETAANGNTHAIVTFNRPDLKACLPPGVIRHADRRLWAAGQWSALRLLRSILFFAIVTDGLPKPRGEKNVGSAGCRASGAARAGGTSPIVLGRVDTAGARSGAVVSANIGDADLSTQQIVEVWYFAV